MRAVEVDVAVQNAHAVPDVAVIPSVLELAYQRVHVADGKPEPVLDTVRIALAPTLRAGAHLVGVASGTSIDVRVLGETGAIRWATRVTAPVESGPVVVELTATDVDAITEPPARTPPPPALLSRRGRLVAAPGPAPRFAESRLYVAAGTITDAWTTSGLESVFGTPAPSPTSREIRGAVPAHLTSWAWVPVHVSVDGSFTATFEVGAGDGWMWWLSGPSSAIGVVLDGLEAEVADVLAIPLPVFATAPVTVETGGRTVPADATEPEIASNPGVFSEDAGAYCRPFANPERVLGERAFHVLSRVEQPLIGPRATLALKDLMMLDFDQPVNGREVGAHGAGASMARTVHVGPLPADITNAIGAFPQARAELTADSPAQWEADISAYQAATIARGHILEYRVRWRSNGYSLGTVAKTLTLAPRQVKRIQKIEWSRRERARRQETTQLVDRVADSVDRERTYDDEVRANLNEWARGESHASSTAGSAGVGFALPGFVIGGGGAHSSASSSSSQEGGRQTVAAEAQRLRDGIHRYAEALRRLESTVVEEVTQEEEVTGTSEIVRNPNYGHALTILYHQILRHLRVDNEFAGVRECLFVPFAIKPFTLARAYRWRDLLSRGLRDPRHAPALKYLRDVVTGFANSDVPVGRRSELPARSVYGSLYLTIGIERPRDHDGNFDELAWLALRPFLGAPPQSVFTRLKDQPEARRDAIFQRDLAPRICAGWLDTLQLEVQGQVVHADFTMATRYSYNNIVRVDFTIDGLDQQTITREMLASMRVRATRSLPPGTVANLGRATFTYETDRFAQTVAVNRGLNDLVVVETGEVDTAGAVVTSTPTAWERQDLRAEMTAATVALLEHLNEHVEHYHKAIWWNMDRDRLFMLLDGFYVPRTQGVSVASIVERDPIAIVGNSLVFRVSAGSFLGLDDLKTPEALYGFYASRQLPRDPMHISLPTDGLYAQAIMDECVALEEHAGSIDWVLDDKDPVLADVAPDLLQSRSTPAPNLQPTTLPQTIINLQNAPEAPAPSGLGGALAAVQNAGAFRDMAGLAGTQANARAAMETAAGLAQSFGSQAAALRLAQMVLQAKSTDDIDKKLAAIEKAKDRKLIDDEEASKRASEALSQMSASEPSLTDDANVRSLLSSAAQSERGATITRGGESVDVRATGESSSGRRLLQLTRDGVVEVQDGGYAGGGGGGTNVLFQTPGAPQPPAVLPSLTDRNAWKNVAVPALNRPCCAFGHDIKVGFGRIPNITDPTSLGKHTYGDRNHPQEKPWGMVYTCRGGFVDLGHARDAVDIAAYVATRAMDLLPRSGSMKWTQEADVTIKFRAPASTSALAQTCSQLGMRIAYQLTTWHEIWSWFSAPTVLSSQMYSAFSPEDAFSNLFGALLAGEALQRREAFDEAVDIVLDQALGALGPRPPAETKLAMDSVDGRWWDSSKQALLESDQFLLRRNFVVDPAVTPWLLSPAGLNCSSPTPVVLDVPRQAPGGAALDTLYTLEIDTSTSPGAPFRQWPPGMPTIITTAEFPALIAAAAHEARHKFGNDADRP